MKVPTSVDAFTWQFQFGVMLIPYFNYDSRMGILKMAVGQQGEDHDSQVMKISNQWQQWLCMWLARRQVGGKKEGRTEGGRKVGQQSFLHTPRISSVDFL